MDNLADRVNLGLLPSSEECWPVACAALKTASGGWLHIHGNVNTKVSQDSLLLQQHLELEDKYKGFLTLASVRCSTIIQWIEHVSCRISTLLNERNPLHSADYKWKVEVRHVEHVKQYAPHISHLVLDVHCQPVQVHV